MVFVYLTTVTLDVITGAAWWTVSKTYNGIHYLIYGTDNKENEVAVDKETLTQLVEDNKNYQSEIRKLSTDINILSDYVKEVKEVKENKSNPL